MRKIIETPSSCADRLVRTRQRIKELLKELKLLRKNEVFIAKKLATAYPDKDVQQYQKLLNQI